MCHHQELCVGYMTTHCVAPQQSLMMETPDFVMDGLFGGVSKICLLGFGAPCRRERGREKDDHTLEVPSACALFFFKHGYSLCVTLSFFSRGISFSLRNSAISLSSSRSLSLTHSHLYTWHASSIAEVKNLYLLMCLSRSETNK